MPSRKKNIRITQLPKNEYILLNFMNSDLGTENIYFSSQLFTIGKYYDISQALSTGVLNYSDDSLTTRTGYNRQR